MYSCGYISKTFIQLPILLKVFIFLNFLNFLGPGKKLKKCRDHYRAKSSSNCAREEEKKEKKEETLNNLVRENHVQ